MLMKKGCICRSTPGACEVHADCRHGRCENTAGLTLWSPGGGHSTFFGGCVPHGFPKVGSRLIAKYTTHDGSSIVHVRSSAQNGSGNASEFCSLSEPDSARSLLKVAEISL